MNHSANKLASAIAGRLSYEWDRKSEFPEDAKLIRDGLAMALGINLISF